MIAALNGAVVKAVISSGGGSPTKIGKLMFISDGIFHNPDTGWNVYSQDDVNKSILDPSGASTGWTANSSGDDWDSDPETSGAAVGDWSAISLERAVYTYGGSGYSKNIVITGLDSAKNYKLRCASRQGYDDAARENRAKITINGVSKYLENQFANTLYEVSFDVNTPSSGTITVNVGTDAVYSLICAMIIEQY